jgi:hypothetical protein
MPVFQHSVFQHSVLRHAAAGLLGLLLGTFAFFVIAAGAILA